MPVLKALWHALCRTSCSGSLRRLVMHKHVVLWQCFVFLSILSFLIFHSEFWGQQFQPSAELERPTELSVFIVWCVCVCVCVFGVCVFVSLCVFRCVVFVVLASRSLL